MARRYAYISGHCGISRHESCRGVYAGTVCTCKCGHQPVDLPMTDWQLYAGDL